MLHAPLELLLLGQNALPSGKENGQVGDIGVHCIQLISLPIHLEKLFVLLESTGAL
jgi:hypothetical protein